MADRLSDRQFNQRMAEIGVKPRLTCPFMPINPGQQQNIFSLTLGIFITAPILLAKGK